MLYIIRGLPGSGKSTYAKKNFPGIVHYEADMFFVKNGIYEFNPTKLNAAHRWCQSKVKSAIEKGRDVVVSNTFIQEWEMLPYLEMVAETVTPVTIIELRTQFKSIHDVPESKIKNMQGRWEECEDMPNVLEGIAENVIYYSIVIPVK